MKDIHGIEVQPMTTDQSIPGNYNPARDEKKLWELTECADSHMLPSRWIRMMAAEVLALRSRLASSQKDAARWQYARQFLAIEDIERWSTDEFWRGHVPGQEESLLADAAIDAAMEKVHG